MPMQAQDTFVAVLSDGTERFVAKGEPFSESHELVRRDAEASRANPGRTPLFRPLDLGDGDRPAGKARGAKAGGS